MATSDFAYDFVEDQTSPRLRQKEHEDWLITSSLEPLRDGLEDCNFQHLLQEFAAEHAGFGLCDTKSTPTSLNRNWRIPWQRLG
eukprot:g9806.t1